MQSVRVLTRATIDYLLIVTVELLYNVVLSQARVERPGRGCFV